MMSLCVAWKYEDAHGSKTCFAADSCVTLQGKDKSSEMPYGGVKILAVPVRIIPPDTNIPGQFGDPFERTFGMAFVDGFLPAFEQHGEGWTFTPRDFADLGDPRLVGTVLTRLVRKGRVRRVRRGLYDCPKAHPILGKTAPDPMAAVRALMEGSSTQWQVSGAYAANLLGLSEQVPGRIVILTNGVPRRMTLGKLTLIFRRAAPRNLLGAGRPAGLVIQAIRHLREQGLETAQLERLRKRLDGDTQAELSALTPKLPAWMRPIVQRLTERTNS